MTTILNCLQLKEQLVKVPLGRCQCSWEISVIKRIQTSHAEESSSILSLLRFLFRIISAIEWKRLFSMDLNLELHLRRRTERDLLKLHLGSCLWNTVKWDQWLCNKANVQVPSHQNKSHLKSSWKMNWVIPNLKAKMMKLSFHQN